MKKIFVTLLKIALVIVCVWYALDGITINDLSSAFAKVDWRIMAIGVAYQYCVFVPMGVRIRMIAGHNFPFSMGYQAAILATGMNNLLPAKLGEVAKVTLLSKCPQCGIGRAVSIVVWERFSDLNSMLIIGGVGMMFLHHEAAMLPVGILTGIFWLVIFLFHVKPQVVRTRIEKITHVPTKHFLTDFFNLIAHDISLPFFLKLALCTLSIWATDYFFVALVMNGICGLDLSWIQLFTVFFFTIVGLAIPSTPGGAGVFEAAVIMGLTTTGISKDVALSSALILHMLMFVPPAIGGVAVLFMNKLSVKDLRGKTLKA
ncbi:MAG: lysylphosphatidylglycerol synthase transmembrane domain-containing protein [Desulfovibrio sp.]